MTKTAKPTEPILAHIPGLHWPQADEGALRTEAAAWRAMASALRRIEPTPAAAVRTITGGNSGAAIDKFGHFWDTKYAGSAGAFPELEKACDAMASALDKYATAVEACKHSIEEKAAVLGATIVVGAALAVFTLGIGAGAAATAADAIVSFSLGAVDVTLAAAATEAITDIVAGVLIGSVSSAVTDLVVQTIKVDAFHDGSFSWGELGKATVQGAAAGGAGGAFGFGLKTLSTSVTELSSESPLIASVMDRLPSAMDSGWGRFATGGVFAGGADLVITGHVNYLDVLSGGIGGLATKAVPEQWDVNTTRGRNFQSTRSSDFPYNKVELTNGERLPSYDPDRTIVSRRYTQFDEISSKSGVQYVRESAHNYREGMTVADTPYNRAHMPGLIGKQLSGREVLEVPVQKGPLPPSVIAAAQRYHVEIVDVTGRVLVNPGS